jgi:hypothetical protein
MNKIFIPFSTPSSKNSRRNFGNRSLPSKATERWRKLTKDYWLTRKGEFLQMLEGKEKPYRVHMQFVRGTRHKFDYSNPCETVQDEMVKYGWLDDDNCTEMMPVFDLYSYNKENPGVWIYVE